MLIGILLTINIIVCLALTCVVLLQRSEGGALGMGGGPTGFMTARGAGDLLTRTTWILFSVFLVLSLALTILSGRSASTASVVDRLKIDGVDPNSLKAPPPAAPATPAPAAPGALPGALTAPTPQVSGLPSNLAPAPATTPAPAPAQ
jgi:preprotein translocase subunit SecG